MRILWTFCIYNEREMLPFKLDYMRRNNIDPYVFDNMSTDGSWEWLQDNKIPSERFDSNGMFDLSINLPLLNRKIHEVKPDWIIISGTDIFYVHALKKSLREVIEWVDIRGFNCIQGGLRDFEFWFTGDEKLGGDPRLTYMYYRERRVTAVLMAKYFGSLVVDHADRLNPPGKKLYEDKDFVLLHYMVRSDGKARKMEEYERRKKAWECGRVSRDHGTHYKAIVEKEQFVFDKKVLLDVRSSIFWEAIKRDAGQLT